MTYKLSQRSLDRMEGVDERLVAVAKAAIGHTKTDFRCDLWAKNHWRTT